MTTNYRSSAHNQKIELIFVIFACRRPAHAQNFSKWQHCNEWNGSVQLFFGTWKREVFEEKKNSFSIENDYIKSWWWCGLNADSIIEKPDTEKKFTLVIEQRDCANYILYIFRPFIALWSKIHKKKSFREVITVWING